MKEKDLDKLKEVFLADDLDEETRADNLQHIREWETALLTNEALASWRDHDMTKKILLQAKDTYRGLCMQLIWSRDLTEAQRSAIYAKQDAALWFISIIEVDAKAAIEQLNREITAALNATN